MRTETMLHEVLIPLGADGRRSPVRFRCPHPKDSTACGLWEENMNHDPEACVAYEEGDDGCEDEAGWVQAPGCAVEGVAFGAGLTANDLFANPDGLPVNTWFAVDVKWDGSFDDSSYTLSRHYQPSDRG